MTVTIELELDIQNEEIFVDEILSLCDRYLKNPQLVLTKGQREFLTKLKESALEAGNIPF